MVSAQLNRNKRYPESAQGQQGAASISFSVDRSGRIVSVRLVRSSGSSALDQEAVAMAHRSSPVPAPPPEIGGGIINLSVPVNFRPR
jgi:protein TonB